MNMRARVIINPKAGRGRGARHAELAREYLREGCVAVDFTRHSGHAAELARQAIDDGCDTIVVVGGDGTINEVVNGSFGSGIAIGVIPAGTSNDLARCHDIPIQRHAAWETIRTHVCRRIDAICVNGWYYLTVAGLGLPSETVAKAGALRSHGFIARNLAQLLGSKLYLLALAVVYRRSTRHASGIRLNSPGAHWSGSVFSLIVANQPFLGSRFRVAPAASTDDGRLDCFAIIDTHSRTDLLLTVLSTVTHSRDNAANALRLQKERLTVESSGLACLFGDGEIHGWSEHFDFHLIPGAVRLIVPAGKGGRT
jgi:diacylglycerol kinase (ATP)